MAAYLSNVRSDPAAEPSEWPAALDDGGDAPKSTIQVLTPTSQLAETTVIVFLKNNVFLLVNLNVQFPPGNDINVPS